MSSFGLTTTDRDLLADALHSAYRNPADLEQLVFFTLGERLDDIAAPGTLPARVMALIQWAEAEGRVDELVRGAHDRRSGNPRMKELREHYFRAWATTPGPPQRPHVVLFLAANPAGTTHLLLDEECAAIERELRMTAGRDDFDFRSKWAVTVDDTMRYFNDLRPTVIHFSGHGHGRDEARADGLSPSPCRDMVPGPGDGGIQLVNEHGAPQSVDGRALARLIASAAPSARVVVLNACSTSELAGPLLEVVDCVVGMRSVVGDAAARSFAVGFYRALGYGSSIANAVKQAVATLGAKQFPEEDLPRCWTREDGGGERLILSQVRASQDPAVSTRSAADRPR
jgi:hypothetical protein